MRQVVAFICLCAVVDCATGYKHCNESNVVPLQLAEFRCQNPVPIGVWTKLPVEPIDIRHTILFNKPDIFYNKHHFLKGAQLNRKRVPERVVHGKECEAYGHFEVTHDISRYTTPDVFNRIGKIIPVFVRFLLQLQKSGLNDLSKEANAISLKLYTRHGNLDLMRLHVPAYAIDFPSFAHSFKKNPVTENHDNNMRWDFITLNLETLHTFLWLMSNILDRYRKDNYFLIHIFVLYTKEGERYFVKFNFLMEIGVTNLTNSQAAALTTENLDYFNADLYNAIATKNYPTWRLEMDVMTIENVTNVDFGPFDITRLWRRGTYHMVPLGRLVLNKVVDNDFKDNKQAGFGPINFVPEILGPIDDVFKARRISYQDALHYRLGPNYTNIKVNSHIYDKVYALDGRTPVLNNIEDAPNYYPNSFNGPMPYVDQSRPTGNFHVFHRNALHLQPMTKFCNEIVESDAHRQRIADNLAGSLVNVTLEIEKRVIYLLIFVDVDLGKRMRVSLMVMKALEPTERRKAIVQCIAILNDFST